MVFCLVSVAVVPGVVVAITILGSFFSVGHLFLFVVERVGDLHVNRLCQIGGSTRDRSLPRLLPGNDDVRQFLE